MEADRIGNKAPNTVKTIEICKDTLLSNDNRLLEMETELQKINSDKVGVSKLRGCAVHMKKLKFGHMLYQTEDENKFIGEVGFFQ